MKQTIIHILSIVLLIMAFPFDSSGKDKVIDFNFPQDVSKAAIADLDQALKTGDGQLTVDALVRYSLAQSGISQDNMADIITRVETVIDKEKQPHIKALLYHLEAMIYQGYRDRFARWSDRENPVEETPADISEWDRKQFDKKITELIEKSLAEPEALKAVAVTSLPGIIKSNELGATYIPTLHEFLLMKGRDMFQDVMEIYSLDDTYAEKTNLLSRIVNGWLKTTEGNVPAHIYATNELSGIIPIETYRQYQDNEHCALLLNSIASKHVNLRYPKIRSSRDSITVTASVKNANAFTIEVYRIPDDMLDEYSLNPSMLQLVSKHPVKVQGIVPFDVNNVVTTLPPLPYGAYIIRPDIRHRPVHHWS